MKKKNLWTSDAEWKKQQDAELAKQLGDTRCYDVMACAVEAIVGMEEFPESFLVQLTVLKSSTAARAASGDRAPARVKSGTKLQHAVLGSFRTTRVSKTPSPSWRAEQFPVRVPEMQDDERLGLQVQIIGSSFTWHLEEMAIGEGTAWFARERSTSTWIDCSYLPDNVKREKPLERFAFVKVHLRCADDGYVLRPPIPFPTLDRQRSQAVVMGPSGSMSSTPSSPTQIAVTIPEPPPMPPPPTPKTSLPLFRPLEMTLQQQADDERLERRWEGLTLPSE
jgi:hypothetical protein